MSITATSVSATSFTVSGDLSAEIVAGMRVKADCGTDGTVTGTVTDSTYASGTGLTTVTLAMDSGGLTSNLTGVLHGNDTPDSMPVASTANRGGVFLETVAETVAGTGTDKASTGAGVTAAIEARLPYGNFYGYNYVATFVSASSCTVSGDRRSVFVLGVKVRADCGADGIKTGVVVSSTYDDGPGLTTIALTMDASTLTANLAGVRPGCTKPDSVANHNHGGTESGGTLTGTPLATPKLTGWREGVQALGTLSADTTIDCAAGNVVTATIGASLTLSFSNVPASGTGGAVELWLTNAGAYTVTWPTGTVWPDATAPTLTASGLDIVVLKTIDGGTSWRGAAVTGYTA